MKNIITILFLLLIFACNNGEIENKTENYTIEGKLKGFEKGQILLSKLENNKLVSVNSTYARNGKFKIFGGKIKSPELYYLQFGNNTAVIEFFLENSNIEIFVDLNKKTNADIKGSKSQDEYASFRENNSVFESRQYDLYLQTDIAKENNDTILLKQLDISYMAVYKEQIDFIKKYVKDNKKSSVATFLASRSLSDIVSEKELVKIRKNFDASMNNTVYIKELDEKIIIKQKLQTGKQAPDFTLKNTKGKNISLSSLQGKYVLLNFWMSKSEKCRIQNLYLKKIYKKHKENGLEILMVSLDENYSNWIKAIEKDSINLFVNLIAEKGTASEIVKLYALTKIPGIFLMNRKGLILAKNLSPEIMAEKINSEFKNR